MIVVGTPRWDKAYFRDLGERVGFTLVYGLITFFTMDATSLDARQLWPVVALPTVLCLLKALLVNLSGDGSPTASLVGVKSRSGDEVK